MNRYSLWLVKVSGLTLLLTGIAMVVGKTLLIGPVYRTENFRFNDVTDKIFIGASHSACSFNNDFFRHSINVAKSGEPVFFTYYKTRALLDQNRNVKTAVLAFSPIHISKSQDYRVMGGGEGAMPLFLDYFIFLDDSGRDYLNKFRKDYIVASLKYDFGLPLSYMKDLKVVLRYYLNRVDCSSYSFWGGVEGINEVHLEDEHIKKKINHYFYGDDGRFSVSQVALDHLYKLIELCRKESVQLILVNTPSHEKFYRNIPDYYLNRYNEIVRNIQKKYPDLIFCDYHDMELPDHYYLDGDHLNIKGRDYFSEYFSSSLISKLCVARTHDGRNALIFASGGPDGGQTHFYK